jgi:LacI family transcriptional regulator
MKSGKVSQQRIARELGVSQALVSLVLNGKRENISRESYDRIWQFALKLGYRPKGMRLAETQGTPTAVGFILRAGLRLHTQSNFFSHVQHGLHAKLLEHGCHSIFLGAEDDLEMPAFRKALRQQNLFGVAVLGQVRPLFLKALKDEQRNVVALSMSYPGISHSVMPNETQAVTLLVEHLTGLGHKRFAWLGGDRGLDYNLRRYHGLIAALKQAGLALEERFTVNVETGDRLAGREAAELLLERMSRKRGPTAWVCANGLMARGVINCLAQRRWRVPEEASVVALDATRVCTEEHPQITGAHSDPERIGAKAAEILLQSRETEQDELTEVIIPAQLSVRETSGPAAS